MSNSEVKPEQAPAGVNSLCEVKIKGEQRVGNEPKPK